MENTSVDVPGSWRHRQIAANGARFHVAEVGAGPLVIFLHGFPEFWWAWRHQLPAFADAGFRAVAMDLRGYGGSDKTPRGYDPTTLTDDVIGVIRSLGARDAVVVGHGWGGYVGWAAARRHPGQMRSLVAVAAPHPLVMRTATRGRLAWHLWGMQVPWIPERRIRANDARLVEQLLRRWSAPESQFPDPEAARRYRTAMTSWPSPHCALEYHRWAMRSRFRSDGREFTASMRAPVDTPVLQVIGGRDPLVRWPAAHASRYYVNDAQRIATVHASGHFVPEEAPEEFNRIVVDWLREQVG